MCTLIAIRGPRSRFFILHSPTQPTRFRQSTLTWPASYAPVCRRTQRVEKGRVTAPLFRPETMPVASKHAKASFLDFVLQSMAPNQERPSAGKMNLDRSLKNSATSILRFSRYATVNQYTTCVWLAIVAQERPPHSLIQLRCIFDHSTFLGGQRWIYCHFAIYQA